ncbi:unnamed protein product [Ostreobium quekettii]|uniref:Uncharacterized protein n=1 Tax=Ostreobium quekettii TaxID=121088 RepID=A0A8S1INA4_9CHLO|nr:unnamed protein product [Ostreobium quekettii]
MLSDVFCKMFLFTPQPASTEPNADVDPQALNLHLAIQAGDVERVQTLLEQRGPDSRYELFGTPAIWRAAFRNESAIVKILIASGMDVNAGNSKGTTALYVAAQNAHVDIVQILIDSGADVNINSVWGSSALMVAASRGHTDVVAILLSAGADFRVQTTALKQSALFLAAANGHPKTVWTLLEGDGNEMIDVADVEGSTPLYAAAYSGQPASVEALLVFKPDLGRLREDGSCPLHAASAGCFHKIVELLVEAGSARGIKNKNGHQPRDLVCLADPDENVKAMAIEETLMPLLIAVRDGNHTEAERLIEAGEDVNGMARNGSTLLQLAVGGGSVRVVDALLNGGADSNVKDATGCGPLHVAVDNSSVGIVVALLEAGADINVVTNDNTSALHVAVRNDDAVMVETLFPFGPNANLQDALGTTPLHTAAAIGNTRIVQLLLDMGADVNLTDAIGQTPLLVAIVNENVDVVALLQNAGKRSTSATGGDGKSKNTTMTSRGAQPSAINAVSRTADSLEQSEGSDSSVATAQWLIPAVLLPVVLVPALLVLFFVRKRHNREEHPESDDVPAKDAGDISDMSDEEWGAPPHLPGYLNEVISMRGGGSTEYWAEKGLPPPFPGREGATNLRDGRVPIAVKARRSVTAAQVKVSPRIMSGHDDSPVVSDYLKFKPSHMSEYGSGYNSGRGDSHQAVVCEIMPAQTSSSADFDEVLQGHQNPICAGAAIEDDDVQPYQAGISFAGSSIQEGPRYGSQQTHSTRSGAGSMSVASWLASEGSEFMGSPSQRGWTVEDRAGEGAIDADDSPPPFPAVEDFFTRLRTAVQSHHTTVAKESTITVGSDIPSPHRHDAAIPEGPQHEELIAGLHSMSVQKDNIVCGSVVSSPGKGTSCAQHPMDAYVSGYASDSSLSSCSEGVTGGSGAHAENCTAHMRSYPVNINVAEDPSEGEPSISSVHSRMIRQWSETSGVSMYSALSHMVRQDSSSSPASEDGIGVQTGEVQEATLPPYPVKSPSRSSGSAGEDPGEGSQNSPSANTAHMTSELQKCEGSSGFLFAVQNPESLLAAGSPPAHAVPLSRGMRASTERVLSEDIVSGQSRNRLSFAAGLEAHQDWPDSPSNQNATHSGSSPGSSMPEGMQGAADDHNVALIPDSSTADLRPAHLRPGVLPRNGLGSAKSFGGEHNLHLPVGCNQLSSLEEPPHLLSSAGSSVVNGSHSELFSTGSGGYDAFRSSLPTAPGVSSLNLLADTKGSLGTQSGDQAHSPTLKRTGEWAAPVDTKAIASAQLAEYNSTLSKSSTSLWHPGDSSTPKRRREGSSPLQQAELSLSSHGADEIELRAIQQAMGYTMDVSNVNSCSSEGPPLLLSNLHGVAPCVSESPLCGPTGHHLGTDYAHAEEPEPEQKFAHLSGLQGGWEAH